MILEIYQYKAVPVSISGLHDCSSDPLPPGVTVRGEHNFGGKKLYKKLKVSKKKTHFD